MKLFTQRALAALSVFVLANACTALTVNIINVTNETCSYANGSMMVSVSGGVPPYTYVWDDGPTVATRTGLSAGTYSVTVTDAMSDQATDQATIISAGYDVFYNATYEYCNAFVAAFSAYDYPGAHSPWYFNGMQASLFDPYNVPDTIWAVVVGQTNGEYFSMSMMDGNGCSGTFSGYGGYQVEYPQVSILDVQPSCSNTNTGSLSLHATEEGHQQYVNMILVDEDGMFFTNVVTMGATAIDTAFRNLAPGDYRLTFWLGATTDALDPGECSPDTIYITVPDIGPVCGQLSGRVYVDADEDCVQDLGEVGAENVLLQIDPGPYYAMTGDNGHYQIALPMGNYTIAQLTSQLQQHCVPDPVPFTMSANTSVILADTSLVPLDMQVSFTHSAARPGFQLIYWIDLDNLTPGSSGNLTLTFQFDPTVSFVNASAGASVMGNTVTWDLPQMSFFDHEDLHVTLQVPSDVGLIGTVLPASVSLVTGNADADLSNNSASSVVTITASFDPNDKTARTSSGLSDTQYFLDQDGYIDYTIRFQNTGTDTAFNVVITDTLAAELDLSTFQMGAASHACIVDLVSNASVNEPNRVVEWTFNNINLPDSNANEPESHGAVSFRIRPVDGLTIGTLIENTANIFFDFNPPVITDPSVLAVDLSTNVQEMEGQELQIFPNPASDQLVVQAADELIGTVSVFAVDGRAVMTQGVHAHQAIVQVAELPAGLYELHLQLTGDRVVQQRFIKH